MGLLLLYGGATLVMAAYGVMSPERTTFALAFCAIGLAATWKHYLAWNARRTSGV